MPTNPKPDDEIDASIEEILSDVERYRRESDEKTRRENPHLTEEQVRASWLIVEKTLGL